MRKVFIVADNIVSPLGSSTAENLYHLKKGETAIRKQENDFSPIPFYAALLEETKNKEPDGFSPFEQIVKKSAAGALSAKPILSRDKKTIFILSSTKGNISFLEDHKMDAVLAAKISLHHSAQVVADRLGFINPPLVVSHACISGLLAMITGMRLIQSGRYDHAVITGADRITRFILSGFQSFQAISSYPCKPFDAARDGITLGEAAGTVILSADAFSSSAIMISGGSVSNDANHISGPSRTGEELSLAISRAMNQAAVQAADIDFISAHGTATLYNDDMEAKAIHLAGLQHVPVNSLKGYYGHTLGAAGIIESVVSIHSMKENILFPTAGFKTAGTEKPVNVIRDFQYGNYRRCLKTASGFGGCNAAVVLEKMN